MDNNETIQKMIDILDKTINKWVEEDTKSLEEGIENPYGETPYTQVADELISAGYGEVKPLQEKIEQLKAENIELNNKFCGYCMTRSYRLCDKQCSAKDGKL